MLDAHRIASLKELSTPVPLGASLDYLELRLGLACLPRLSRMVDLDRGLLPLIKLLLLFPCLGRSFHSNLPSRTSARWMDRSDRCMEYSQDV